MTAVDDLAGSFRRAAQEYDEHIPVTAIREHPDNPNEGMMSVLEESMTELGFYGAVLVQKSSGRIIAGNHRFREAVALGAETVPGFWLDVSDDDTRRIMSVDNESTRLGHVNKEKLLALLRPLSSLRGTGYTKAGLLALLRDGGHPADSPNPSLADRFGAVPFDVLDARQGWWAARKRAWIGLGIRSELGRLANDMTDRTAGAFPRRAGFEKAYADQRAADRAEAPQVAMNYTGLRDEYAERALGPTGWGTGVPSRADPNYYPLKKAAEEAAGRPLSNEEFEADWYTPVTDGIGSGKSVFDPVLCELAYRWFCPPGGQVIDPFAGGSVRGLVASVLGRPYYGCDLSGAQVAENRRQADDLEERGIIGQVPAQAGAVVAPAVLTPVQARGPYWVKRDDLFVPLRRACGGKARAVMAMAGRDPEGLVTCGSRRSVQITVVAAVAADMAVPCRVHVAAAGEASPEVQACRDMGAEVIEHQAGRVTVLAARARDDAAHRFGWTLIPFGLEGDETIDETKAQVANLAEAPVRRVVVPVGSGMTLAGVLWGLHDRGSFGLRIDVLGVVVGANPEDRLDKWAPPGWRDHCTLVRSGLGYDDEAERTDLDGLPLDPLYEAKCLPFLEPGDLLWVAGARTTGGQAMDRPPPTWVTGDSARADQWDLDHHSADFLMTCPPYYDLEVYSDAPGELSAMTAEDFDAAMVAILARCYDALRPDRFAVIVTGDSRSRRGGPLRDLRGAVITAARMAGFDYANGAVLVTPVGSIPITAARMFTGTRNMARTHQDVLVFCKGDRARAAQACGPVDVSWPDALAPDDEGSRSLPGGDDRRGGVRVESAGAQPPPDSDMQHGPGPDRGDPGLLRGPGHTRLRPGAESAAAEEAELGGLHHGAPGPSPGGRGSADSVRGEAGGPGGDPGELRPPGLGLLHDEPPGGPAPGRRGSTPTRGGPDLAGDRGEAGLPREHGLRGGGQGGQARGRWGGGIVPRDRGSADPQPAGGENGTTAVGGGTDSRAPGQDPARVIPTGPVDNGPVPVQVSTACAWQRFHGCDPDYIRDVCHGRCCTAPGKPGGAIITVHRSEQAAMEAYGAVVRDGRLVTLGGRCQFQGPEGLCSIHAMQPSKPFHCWVSPFILAPGGRTLIVSNRYRALICYQATSARQGIDTSAWPPAWQAFASSLRVLFGEAEAGRLSAVLDAAGDARAAGYAGPKNVPAWMLRRSYDMLTAKAAELRASAK